MGTNGLQMRTAAFEISGFPWEAKSAKNPALIKFVLSPNCISISLLKTYL